MDNITLFYRATPSNNNTVNLKVEDNYKTTLGIELGDSELSMSFYDTDRCTPALNLLIDTLIRGVKLDKPGVIKEWFTSTDPLVGGITVARYRYQGTDQTTLTIFHNTTLISIVGDSYEIITQMTALIERFTQARELLEKV